MLKNKSCQNYVLTIPLCRGGRDEATVENRVKIRRRKRPHAPARWLATRTDARHASHASSSPGWADPTRILDNPTHVPDPDKDDVIMTPVHIVSMHVSAQSADTSSSSQHAMSASSHLTRHQRGPTCHVISLEPSRAEPRDKILCNGVYVQPDLRLNLSR